MSTLGLTDEQLITRRRGIGGSDIAALLGLDPYRGPFDVWCEKTGRAAARTGNRFTTWGNRLEAVVADAYAERHDVQLKTSGTLVHPQRTWQVGTPDRLVVEIPFGRPPGALVEADRGLEIKCRGLRQAWRWGDESAGAAGVPDEVLAQAHWYASLTGLPRWDVAVLLDGNDFRTYQVERDAEIEAGMLEVGARFWRDHVEADKAPELDGGDAAWNYVRSRLSPTKRLADVDAGTDIDRLAGELIEVTAALKHADERREVLRQQLADLAAGLGVGGFAGPDWRFVLSQVAGKPRWKAIAERLGERLPDFGQADMDALASELTSEPGLSVRFTSRRLAGNEE